MWTLAFAVFLGCKWLTWRNANPAGTGSSLGRAAAYLLLWVGMDPKPFLRASRSPERPSAAEWRRAVGNTALGLALIGLFVPLLAPHFPVLAAWAGLVGLVLALHFGAFGLLALAWRRVGVPVEPIMQQPLRSRSLSEFWGRRWNLGFRRLSHDFVYLPLRARCGPGGAMLLTFLASGLIHELVISVPAEGGYGLPTGYFLLQGLGLLLERSRPVRRLAAKGAWVFTLLWTATPAYFLFHPRFIHEVAIPMWTALGLWS
jgi:alginate O-acetyltransferase complex protein AlgI